MNELESLYLAHHGILGQKWGKRNGPPYPLGAGEHSAREKKDGYTKSIGGGRNEKLYDRYDKNHKGINNLGGSGASSSVSSKSESSNTESSVKKERPKASPSESIDKETGLKKLSKPETESERLEKCNPNFKQTNNITPYNRNCGNTVIANELRRRGLDVEARGNNIGLTATNMKEFFNDADKNTIEIVPNVKPLKSKIIRSVMFGKFNTPKIQNEIKSRGEIVRDEYAKALASKYSNGSTGCMQITGLFGSHWISWEIKNGKVEFTNPQDPKEDLLVDFGLHVNQGKAGAKPTAIKLNDLSINNSKIKNVVMDYGGKADEKGMSFNPLLTSGIDFTKTRQDLLQQQVDRYYGPMWDGSWDYFDAIENKTVKELTKKAG